MHTQAASAQVLVYQQRQGPERAALCWPLTGACSAVERTSPALLKARPKAPPPKGALDTLGLALVAPAARAVPEG